MRAGVHSQLRRLLHLPRRVSARWVGIGVQTAAMISVQNAMCSSTTWYIAVQDVANSTGANFTLSETKYASVSCTLSTSTIHILPLTLVFSSCHFLVCVDTRAHGQSCSALDNPLETGTNQF